MIAWLDGIVQHRDPQQGEVILNVGGVGYCVWVSLQCLASVPQPQERCALWVHTDMREHQISLFGFAHPRAKQMFGLLTTVPKVGPKLALSALGAFVHTELVQAIADGDAAKLQKIPGVGKRTAEQIVLTLQDRVIKSFDLSESEPGAAGDAQGSPQAQGDARFEQAETMLVALGWKAKPVQQVLGVMQEDTPVDLALDELVRRALARLKDQNG